MSAGSSARRADETASTAFTRGERFLGTPAPTASLVLSSCLILEEERMRRYLVHATAPCTGRAGESHRYRSPRRIPYRCHPIVVDPVVRRPAAAVIVLPGPV